MLWGTAQRDEFSILFYFLIKFESEYHIVSFHSLQLQKACIVGVLP